MMREKDKNLALIRMYYRKYAKGGTRTPKGFLPLPPQGSVSTSSTTSAKDIKNI